MTATTGTEAASTNVSEVGFLEIIVARAKAYSAYAPMNRGFVTPYTSSPVLHSGNAGPHRHNRAGQIRSQSER